MDKSLLLRAASIAISVILLCNGLGGCGFKKHRRIPLLEEVLQKEELKETTLTFYFQGREGKYMREVLDEVENISRDRLNARLDFKWISSSSYLSEIRKIISSDSPCDAFYYSNPGRGVITDGLNKLSKDGMLLDITDIFPRNAPGYCRKFSEEELNAAKVNGVLYGVPNRMPTASRRVAVVRDDLMKKYNIPEIKSYRDFEAYMSIIKENEPGIFPLMMNNTALGLFAEASGYAVIDSNIGLVYKWDDPDIKIIAWEQTPEYREGIKTLQSWSQKGYFPKNFSILTRPDYSMISFGKLASSIGAQTTQVSYNLILRSNNVKDWWYREYPLYKDKAVQRSSPADNMMLFSRNSKNPERAVMFIEWLQSCQENYDLLMYGIIGKHYELNGNQYTLHGEVKYDDAHINWNGRRAFMNMDYERSGINEPPDYNKAYIESIRTTTRYPPHMGFYPDYQPVIDIAKSRERSYYSVESYINRGFFTMDKVDEYIKDQKNLGVDRLLTSVQSQLDSWRAAKKKQ